MSRHLLERAQELILRQEYDAARKILSPLGEKSSTARKWLANLPQQVQVNESVKSAPTVVNPAVTLQSQPESEIADDEFLQIQSIEDSSTSFPVRWEYREIVLKNWRQHLSNIEYALEQGGEKITIEDAYTHLLNENGAQGWEVISEEILPQQYIRLLMKRPVY